MNPNVKTETRKIPLGRPVFNQEEAQALAKVCETPWVLDGPEVRKFEECFKNYTGAVGAASVSNCTAGMHLALVALGLPEGSEVLLPAFNFVADGLSVLQARLKPCFVEVNPETGNMDVKDLAKRITRNTKAILALHYAGYPSNMDAILALAKENNIKIVEDASHALGASYRGKKVGAIGDATVFSFGPLKMICTGMGGMVTANDPAIAEKIASLRSYGMNKSMWNRRESKRPWNYLVSELGHNFRMTDFQATMGIIQMAKLPHFIEVRKKLSARYSEGLRSISAISFFSAEPGSEPVPLYYVIKVKKEFRDGLAIHLNEKGIGASVHWDPALHRHPLYQDLKLSDYNFPKSDELAAQIMSLPLSPVMTEEDVDYIVDHIKDYLSKGQAA